MEIVRIVDPARAEQERFPFLLASGGGFTKAAFLLPSRNQYISQTSPLLIPATRPCQEPPDPGRIVFSALFTDPYSFKMVMRVPEFLPHLCKIRRCSK